MEGSLRISLKDHLVIAPDGYKYELTMKFFNLYVQLALQRAEEKGGGGFVDVGYIGDLPLWEQSDYLSIGKQISRHMRSMEKLGRNIIEYQQRVMGPYRLRVGPELIVFDENRENVKDFLGLIPISAVSSPASMETFYNYVQSMWEGDVAFNEGNLSEALMQFRRAAENGISPENTITAMHREGRVLDRLGRYRAAHDCYEKAEELIRSERRLNYWLLAENRLDHGWLYYRDQDLGKAEEKYRQALDLVRGKRHYDLLGGVHNALGKVFEKKGNYRQALAFYQQALWYWVAISYFYGIQSCYFNIGNLYKIWADQDLKLHRGKLTGYARDKYETAIVWAKRCVTFCDRTGIGDDMSQDRILVSYCYWRLAKYDQALSYALEAKEMAEASGNKRDLAESSKRLGVLYWAKKDREKALQYLKESVDFYLELGDKGEVKDLREEFGLE